MPPATLHSFQGATVANIDYDVRKSSTQPLLLRFMYELWVLLTSTPYKNRSALLPPSQVAHHQEPTVTKLTFPFIYHAPQHDFRPCAHAGVRQCDTRPVCLQLQGQGTYDIELVHSYHLLFPITH